MDNKYHETKGTECYGFKGEDPFVDPVKISVRLEIEEDHYSIIIGCKYQKVFNGPPVCGVSPRGRSHCGLVKKTDLELKELFFPDTDTKSHKPRTS